MPRGGEEEKNRPTSGAEGATLYGQKDLEELKTTKINQSENRKKQGSRNATTAAASQNGFPRH